MDPTKCLNRIREAYKHDDLDQIAEATSELERWISSAGVVPMAAFLPKMSERNLEVLLIMARQYAMWRKFGEAVPRETAKPAPRTDAKPDPVSDRIERRNQACKDSGHTIPSGLPHDPNCDCGEMHAQAKPEHATLCATAIDSEHDASNCGAIARREGIGRGSDPYPMNSANSSAWLRGWDVAAEAMNLEG